jgi:hypothetical protein
MLRLRKRPRSSDPRYALRRFVVAVLVPGALAFGLACDSGGPSVAEALQTKAEDQLPPDYTPTPKPRPKGLAPPTEAEFKAWDRKDPEGEKHLYKWDKGHYEVMLDYWEQLECFREQVREQGDKAFGAEPGSPTEEQWFQFKHAYVNHVDGWQKRLFSEQPRILEKSKYIGKLLEAHELCMYGYLKAFNDGDKTELQKQDALWAIVEAKMKKYTLQLGGKWPERDLSNAKAAAAHAKVCERAMTPPDRSGKEKRRSKKKSPW